MSDETNEQKPKKQVEHIALSETSSKKITNWIEQVQAKKKGVRITRKDFMNWRIEEDPDALSSKDVNALIERFYDEESFLRQLLRDIKKAKKSGQTEPTIELVVRPKKLEQKDETTSNASEEAGEI
jgi:hypothetical protein